MRLPNIPDDVWATRPLLKDIRAEAHRRCAGADAVLWSYLVGVAAHIPAHVRIDTGIGVAVRPTLYAVLGGASGTGKSLAFGVGRSLLERASEPLPLSTGEGMIEAFWGRVQVEQEQPPGADGKPRPKKLIWVRRRVRSNAWFWLDEAESLFRQFDRPGNIVGPVMRSFWSGGTVGQANAGEEARRGLDAGTYTGGLVAALQPDISGRLLSDTGTGTAQRFIWCASTDEHLTDEGSGAYRLPTALRWSPPIDETVTPSSFMTQAIPGGVWKDEPEPTPVTMTLGGDIARTLREQQVALRRGDVEPDEHDTQRTAQHVKVGAVLAWTDGRKLITPDDWQLAEALLAASDRVREALIEHADEVVLRERADQGLARAQVTRATEDAEVLHGACQTKVMDILLKARTTALREKSEPWVSHSDLRKQITPRQRADVFPEVMRRLVAKGTVAEQLVAGGKRYSISLAKGGDGG